MTVTELETVFRVTTDEHVTCVIFLAHVSHLVGKLTYMWLLRAFTVRSVLALMIAFVECISLIITITVLYAHS